MRLIWERLKVVIEPSAAVGLAAVLSDQFKSKWDNNLISLDDEMNNDNNDNNNQTKSIQKIGIILCGGNIDLNQVGNIFSS